MFEVRVYCSERISLNFRSCKEGMLISLEKPRKMRNRAYNFQYR